MSKPERGYQVFTAVDEYGFANSGLSAVINDRDTSLTVPWEASHTSTAADPTIITWHIKSEDGLTYTVTVPVVVTYDSSTQQSTVTYTHGTYTVTAPSNGGA
jgi:hypothetical protein